jgi:hypothetical protein
MDGNANMIPHQLRAFAKLLNQASLGRNKLVLIIGESGSGKTRFLAALSAAHYLPVLNLGAQLGTKLLAISPRKRPLAIEATVQELIEHGQSGVCIDNTDILFDQALRCDPIRLAYNVSQNSMILYALTGRLEGRRFVRGYPDHPEYFSEEIPAIPTVFMERGAPTFYYS